MFGRTFFTGDSLRLSAFHVQIMCFLCDRQGTRLEENKGPDSALEEPPFSWRRDTVNMSYAMRAGL